MRRFIHRRLGVELAEELAAETFTRAFKARRRFDAERSDAAPWLFGIANNLMRNHLRTELRKLRAYARTGVDPIGDFDGGAESRVISGADRRALVAALAKLSKDDREVILMHAWADFSTQQMAEAIGVPEGTVRSRLSRARKKLREELGRLEDPLETDTERQEVGR